ncbi:hypothetical protein [Paraburkholderia sp.]|uniref:hypothetical protein n=1 Tax=Paraburkholderia sp. TaxID=1926495 RepID=UPI0039E26653
MTKPSERIVVFVTTAQKRAITTTAEDLGISVSELMRRAVLSFGATSEQVKAASIVDRLRAPRAPDALNVALQRVARGTRHARAALPASLEGREAGATDAAVERAAASDAAEPAATGGASNSAPEPAPLLPAGVAAALAAEQDEQAAATAEAVARLTAARAAEADDPAQQQQAGTPARPRNSLKRPRIDKTPDDDESHGDPSTEGGRFA